MLSAITNSINEWKEKVKQERMKQMNEDDDDNDDGFDRLNQSRSRKRRDEESICYHNFGCFRDEGAFDYLNMLPGVCVQNIDYRSF